MVTIQNDSSYSKFGPRTVSAADLRSASGLILTMNKKKEDKKT